MIVYLHNCTRFKTIRFASLIIFILLITACDENPPIPEKKFIEVYVDLLICQDTTTASYNPDSLKSFVLTKHNIPESQYNSMIEYYNQRPDKWIAFFDSVTTYVEQLKLEAENQP
jgi:hypothetical protein